jgi:hypothetical protein
MGKAIGGFVVFALSGFARFRAAAVDQLGDAKRISVLLARSAFGRSGRGSPLFHDATVDMAMADIHQAPFVVPPLPTPSQPREKKGGEGWGN